MPLLTIQTNLPLSADKSDILLHALTDLVVREMNKPLEYVQVLIEADATLHFAGSGDASAFVELRALDFATDQAKPLSAVICKLLKDHLNIPPERVFINFFNIPRPLWGWNATTFA